MTDILKKAYHMMMSYDISDAEKYQAENSIICFNASSKALATADKYLNIIYTPFKDNPEMSKEDVMKIRAALRRYRDTSVDKFNNFKKISFKCVASLSKFAFDTQISKFTKSYISEIEVLEANVNDFVALFDNLEDKEFSKKIVSQIENIHKQCEQISELINQRIIKHIQDNILSKNWTSEFDKDNLTLKHEDPLMVMLENKNK